MVQFHAPTSDLLDQRLLARIIRDGVGELFGEWGVGVVGGSLKGMCLYLFVFLFLCFYFCAFVLCLVVLPKGRGKERRSLAKEKHS